MHSAFQFIFFSSAVISLNRRNFCLNLRAKFPKTWKNRPPRSTTRKLMCTDYIWIWNDWIKSMVHARPQSLFSAWYFPSNCTLHMSLSKRLTCQGKNIFRIRRKNPLKCTGKHTHTTAIKYMLNNRYVQRTHMNRCVIFVRISQCHRSLLVLPVNCYNQ